MPSVSKKAVFEDFQDIELGKTYIDSRGFLHYIEKVEVGPDRFKFCSHTGQKFSKTGKSEIKVDTFNLVSRFTDKRMLEFDGCGPTKFDDEA
jgi:hypothetical protein